jgi:hypothetical protein
MFHHVDSVEHDDEQAPLGATKEPPPVFSPDLDHA